jgi:signal transduction protein with GAF and PtsI domain
MHSDTRPLDDALRAIIARFAAETGTIHLLRGETLELVALHGDYPPSVRAMIERIPVGKGMAGVCAARREPVTVCNLQVDANDAVRPGAKLTGMEGAIVVPMLGPDGSLRGTLGIANRSPRTWSEEESKALQVEANALVASRPGASALADA